MKIDITKIFKSFTNTHLFWAVYVTFLFVLWPQAAWTINQAQDTQSDQWIIMGVSASPLAWALAGVVEATIGIVTHRLNEHWRAMPRWKVVGISDDATKEEKKKHNRKNLDVAWKRISYRWLNAYALALIVAMLISAVANYMHVVQFTNESLKVFDGSIVAIKAYQVIFGLALPGVSFVFARVLSTMQESEQEEDPALAKANAALAEARSNIREKDAAIRQAAETLRQTEQRLEESEQRYRAVGDVVRWLFGKDIELRDRILGIRTSFPKLSQNGIAQILECSSSTVSETLQGYAVDLQGADTKVEK